MSELKEKLRYVNKEKIEQISAIAINDKDILDELVVISLNNEEYISQHAALIILAIARINKEILSPYIEDFIDTIPNLSNASQLGSFVDMFGYLDADYSKLYDFLFDLIEFSEKPGFVKIYSIKMLGKATQRDKKLKQRLIEFIEIKNDNITSKYLKKEATNVLKELKGENTSKNIFV